jgi:transcriptional regulator with XRE-family HTH domain
MHGSLPARLRVLRARQGLTLIDAAEQIGIGRDTLSDLERGNRHPVMPTLAKIAEGYGVPVEELLEEPSEAQEPELAAHGPKGEAPRDTGPIEVHDRALEEQLREMPDFLDVYIRGIEYMTMEREDFEALRAAVHEYSADEGEALFGELHREYNRVWDAWTALDSERTPPYLTERARNLFIESRKRWTVLLYERQAPAVRQDERRSPEAPDLPDTTSLLLDEAFDVVRARVPVLTS